MVPEINHWKQEIFQKIDLLASEIIAHSDDLADHPELGRAEYESSKKITNIMRNHGIDVEMPFAGLPTAFKGSVRGKGKRRIAFLLEYDALPEIGHACGHCVSGSLGLLAGLGFSAVREAIAGELDLIGTPAEETYGAKVEMTKNGVFDNYDAAIMIHMYDRNSVEARFLALDAIEFTFTGKSAHASGAPWQGKNALNGVQLMFHAIDMLRQHVLPEVKIHGFISQGGTAPNVVPEKAVARFNIRASNRRYLNQVVEMVKDCAKGAAIATQTKVEIRNYETSFDEMIVNPAGEAVLTEIYQDMGLQIIQKESYSVSSSDLANVSHVCPAFHPRLAITELGVRTHTREFAAAVKSDKAHQVLVLGAKILTIFALKVFHDEMVREAIWKDFKINRERASKVSL